MKGWRPFKNKGSGYDSEIIKVFVLASALIIVSISLMSYITYTISKNSVINKLKNKDLVYTIESISSKIDGRIERAKETSLILSRDPSIKDWIAGEERNKQLEKYAIDKIADVSKDYDYDNSFIVSTLTNHYWSEKGKIIDTVSTDDPDDSWFFDLLKKNDPVSISIDYNNERKGTYVFVNAITYLNDKPIAVTGAGLSLDDISKELQSYKFGEKSNMWLIDDKGRVYLSEDIQQINENVSSFLPGDVVDRITGSSSTKYNVLEYKQTNGETYDLIYENLKSTDWKLVLQIPRSESLAILRSIVIYTILACLIAIMAFVVIFYLISMKIANPYKRALIIQKELEDKVTERTRELKEKNQKIIDSIEYAKMIQESILPSNEKLGEVFKEYFVLWKPRDIVGGDFYWVRRVKNGTILAVGDCTGHGVPGALMTMAVNSILNQIIDNICPDNPGEILKNLNKLFRETLNNRKENYTTDDGLDIGICYIEDKRLVFAGAKTPLYIERDGELLKIKGNNRSLGYKRTDEEYEYTNHEVNLEAFDVLYLSTDGYTDQNGGDKNNSFGKRKFEELIVENYKSPVSKQKEIFEKELTEYMGNEPQRDDITLLCVKLI